VEASGLHDNGFPGISFTVPQPMVLALALVVYQFISLFLGKLPDQSDMNISPRFPRIRPQKDTKPFSLQQHHLFNLTKKK
jgi:hypothetical protein